MDSQEKLQRNIGTAVFLLSLFLRFTHNGFIMESPLYVFPLGGHVPYLNLARQIVSGDIFPFDGPFTLNSPIYPYILALEYGIAGVGNLFFVRLTGIVIDSLSCVLIALLAFRHFGTVAGVVSGVASAIYAPMIFFSAELTPVPYTLFLILLSIFIMDRSRSLY